MTNGSIMSRRGCVEKIDIFPDGIIPTVEMTSLGFEEALNPYEITYADTACVLRDGGLITELDPFTLVLTKIKNGTVMGWKYYDFGTDDTNGVLRFAAKIIPHGCSGKVHIYADEVSPEHEIGDADFERGSTLIFCKTKLLTGRHAIFLAVEDAYKSWAKDSFKDRQLFDLISFVFMK
jgi:hypothetical protein